MAFVVVRSNVSLHWESRFPSSLDSLSSSVVVVAATAAASPACIAAACATAVAANVHWKCELVVAVVA